MMDYRVSRQYVRTDNWSVKAKASEGESDKGRWFDVKISEISAGGFLCEKDMVFKKGDTLWFKLHIDPMIPGISDEIKMKVKGVVRSDRGKSESGLSYGIEFVEIAEPDRLRLDALVTRTISRFGTGAINDD